MDTLSILWIQSFEAKYSNTDKFDAKPASPNIWSKTVDFFYFDLNISLIQLLNFKNNQAEFYKKKNFNRFKRLMRCDLIEHLALWHFYDFLNNYFSIYSFSDTFHFLLSIYSEYKSIFLGHTLIYILSCLFPTLFKTKMYVYVDLYVSMFIL